jgi:hypothetical protein
MSAIWQNDGSVWRLLSPSGFPDESALHGLVEQAPHILPLAGGPRLVVVGREVLLGGNYADLIAVESSGRVAIVEIKLAKNAEARRAVVAQVLTYAAYLRGMDASILERQILSPHLQRRHYESLSQAVGANDQEGSFDEAVFANGLTESLRDGRFRLVLVLDDAPPELVRLVGYLGAVADKLLIDLVTVAAYQIGGSQVVVPQRVDDERAVGRQMSDVTTSSGTVDYPLEGTQEFIATIAQAVPEDQQLLRRLVDWAAELEAEGLVKLWTYHGKSGRTTLLPRIPGDNVGLVTIWNDKGPALSFWRSVFERRSPEALTRIEQLHNSPKIGQGTTTRAITPELLEELTEAYREAGRRRAELDRPGSMEPQEEK